MSQVKPTLSHHRIRKGAAQQDRKLLNDNHVSWASSNFRKQRPGGKPRSAALTGYHIVPLPLWQGGVSSALLGCWYFRPCSVIMSLPGPWSAEIIQEAGLPHPPDISGAHFSLTTSSSEEAQWQKTTAVMRPSPCNFSEDMWTTITRYHYSSQP